ncbi:MAG: ribosome-binding factor A [bacterium]|nr:ribosome-binding factor A [bacterium]
MNFRKERINDLIGEELGRIIEKELEFPGTLVTVVRVQVNKKMDRADIGFSVFPSEKADGALKTLNREKGNLRNLLKEKVKMKFMPQLEFEVDLGNEDAAHVEKLLLEEDK